MSSVNDKIYKLTGIKTKLGYVKIYTGPMFAGKTTRMVWDVERYRLAKKSCIIIRHSSDTRYTDDSTKILTHSGQEYDKTPIMLSDDLLSLDLSEYDVVGIDELQFFVDNVPGVEKLAQMGKIVICAALDADYRAQPFGNIHLITAAAEYVEKLSAVCVYCGDNAGFTVRTSTCTDVVEVGGADKYVSTCRTCKYYKHG